MIQRKTNASGGLMLLLAALCLLALPHPVTAAEADARSRFAPDAEIRAAFEPVIEGVRPSVVELVDDGERLVLGTIVDEAGYVLSKASELVGRENLTCYLADGRRFEAELVGVDRLNDLAMLKIEAQRLKAVTLVDDEPAIGRWVVSAGQEKSPKAVGIVSSKAREITPPQLVLGVLLRNETDGPRVLHLSEGFGAAEAGVKVGDVLKRVEGKRVALMEQVIDRLQGRAVGDEVAITLLRGEKELEVSVRLSELLPDPDSRSERMNRMGGDISERRRGFERVLQHDAEIRPEHCGGPIVNLKGEVIGLNIARAGRIETYALPASLLKEKLAALKSGELAPQQSEAPVQPVNSKRPDPASEPK